MTLDSKTEWFHFPSTFFCFARIFFNLPTSWVSCLRKELVNSCQMAELKDLMKLMICSGKYIVGSKEGLWELVLNNPVG